MGLIDRLFRRDPHRTLERAEKLLARGDAVEALRLAEQALTGASLSQANRAESIARRAREALVTAALEKAALAESSGFFEDAAEWIGSALEHVADEEERAALERRAADLRESAREQERELRAASRFEIPEVAEGEEGKGAGAAAVEPDVDVQYEALVNTLDDDVAERYDERPEAFRRAYVQLNEGEVQEARSSLEELAEAHPDDPVYQFERGRSRLLTGDFEGARHDLEAVWETFGDEPLDHARSLSVPGMWAEAMLGAGKAESVLERLDEVALPREGDPVLCHNYAIALTVTHRLEEARDYLIESMNYFSQPDFPHQLAAVLHAMGRTGEAIETLERAVAPSCSPAGCRQAPMHVPSLRSLAGLYLDQGRGFGRVEDLLSYIAQAQNGRLEAEDHLLLAAYYQKQGDEEAAAEAAAKARQLGAA